MKFENILITYSEYKKNILYVHYRHYYASDKYYNKILKFKNVKKYTYFLSDMAINFLEELNEVEKEYKIKYFSRPFYKNRKRNQIYIFDRVESFFLIQL